MDLSRGSNYETFTVYSFIITSGTVYLQLKRNLIAVLFHLQLKSGSKAHALIGGKAKLMIVQERKYLGNLGTTLLAMATETLISPTVLHKVIS